MLNSDPPALAPRLETGFEQTAICARRGDELHRNAKGLCLEITMFVIEEQLRGGSQQPLSGVVRANERCLTDGIGTSEDSPSARTGCPSCGAPP